MNAVHQISAMHAWHGRLLVLAWAVLLPLGMLVARYFKVTRAQHWPRRLDNRLWWHSHIALQVLGVLCMSVGVGIVWLGTRRTAFGTSLHATLGWLIVLLTWLQLVGGSLRGSKGGPPGQGTFDASRIERGDHYDMTRRRIVFEWLHKIGGYTTLALSPLVIALGLQRADAPLWMWLTLGCWWALLLAWASRLQAAGRCIDTYQAIWGPDPRHPGNARPVIGWGVRRHGNDRKHHD